jgi:hypothetical protein
MASGFDIKSAATNAVTKAKTVVDTSVVQGLSNARSSVNSVINSVTSGVGAVKSGVTDLLNGKIPSVKVEKLPLNISGRLPNPLSYYSSYNYNFTLSVLEDGSLNNPDETYRKGQIGRILLKSGSGSPADRIPTIYKTKANPSGSFDFFMDDLRINHVIGFNEGTGNSNATGLSCKIIEPYSMGLFFQALQTAAIAAGHENYLQAPLLLTIEFKGHVNADMQGVNINGTKKFYPVKIRNLNMRVSGEGSVYEVDMYPVNEEAFASKYSQFKTDISIKGQNVVEMLQTGDSSLQKVLNDAILSSATKNKIAVPDQILISFPIDLKTGTAAPTTSDAKGATVNPNINATQGQDLFTKLKLKAKDTGINKTLVQEEGTVNHIGNSSMGFTLYNGAEVPFAKDNLAYDSATGTYKRPNINLTIKPTEGEFRFGQGSDVINAINQVILMSEYGRTALKNVSKDGFVKWWRIETHLYNIPTQANIGKTGDKPKLIVYRVVPYDANVSEVSPAQSASVGIKEDKAQVLKEYNYIYSGQNTEIINFEIEFKAGFYTSINADSGANNDGVQRAESQSNAAENKADELNRQTKGASNVQKGAVPTQTRADSVKNPLSGKGGGGLEDAASIAARQFHGVVTSGTNMIGLDLTILGDPYYLGDSGVGNYSAQASDNRYINSDYAMNWQSGEVHVLTNFRTPTDINHLTGMYDFSNTKEVSQFSGLYRVLRAESTFNAGKFTQVLKLIRLPNQENPPAVNPNAAILTSPDTVGYDDNGEEAIAELEKVARAEGYSESSGPTSAEIAANNAALGDFAG